jgi:DNA-nicking Smr family endonuclease
MSLRRLRPEEAKLWATVLSTVRPGRGRVLPVQPAEPDAGAPPMHIPLPAKAASGGKRPQPAPEDIEPNRKRRIVRGRDDLDARLDLHGLDQDRARLILESFLRRAHADGHRAALVITGKGVQGDGILKRRAPEWLSDPALRGIVAGFSTAAKHHGGEGALYVALKRKAAG